MRVNFFNFSFHDHFMLAVAVSIILLYVIFILLLNYSIFHKLSVNQCTSINARCASVRHVEYLNLMASKYPQSND